jgi:hypothetical protein
MFQQEPPTVAYSRQNCPVAAAAGAAAAAAGVGSRQVYQITGLLFNSIQFSDSVPPPSLPAVFVPPLPLPALSLSRSLA